MNSTSRSSLKTPCMKRPACALLGSDAVLDQRNIHPNPQALPLIHHQSRLFEVTHVAL